MELAAAQRAERLAIVGHQPNLSNCLSELIGGGHVAFGKGFVAAVEFRRPAVGSGQLLWFVGPRMDEA
jgi:phosphohistidine phosphatase